MIVDEQKPYSQACANNRLPILWVLQRVFSQARHVLEIGSGTGQHAVYFAPELTHLRWQTSDLPAHLPGISLWLQENPYPNLPPPIALDVTDTWPALDIDAVFSANTAHIMPWEITQLMIQKVAEALPGGGTFALYGPFNYNGAFTSDSNARFDVWLKANNAEQGIRDFEKVDGVARQAGLELLEDNCMPANNRLLVWRKPRG